MDHQRHEVSELNDLSTRQVAEVELERLHYVLTIHAQNALELSTRQSNSRSPRFEPNRFRRRTHRLQGRAGRLRRKYAMEGRFFAAQPAVLVRPCRKQVGHVADPVEVRMAQNGDDHVLTRRAAGGRGRTARSRRNSLHRVTLAERDTDCDGQPTGSAKAELSQTCPAMSARERSVRCLTESFATNARLELRTPATADDFRVPQRSAPGIGLAEGAAEELVADGHSLPARPRWPHVRGATPVLAFGRSRPPRLLRRAPALRADSGDAHRRPQAGLVLAARRLRHQSPDRERAAAHHPHLVHRSRRALDSEPGCPDLEPAGRLPVRFRDGAARADRAASVRQRGSAVCEASERGRLPTLRLGHLGSVEHERRRDDSRGARALLGAGGSLRLPCRVAALLLREGLAARRVDATRSLGLGSVFVPASVGRLPGHRSASALNREAMTDFSRPKTVSTGIARFLWDQKACAIFAVSGGGSGQVYSALADSQIRFVHCRREDSCVYAATEASVISDRPAAVCVTSGEALGKAVSGLSSARAEAARILLLSGFSDPGTWAGTAFSRPASRPCRRTSSGPGPSSISPGWSLPPTSSLGSSPVSTS